MNRMLSVKKEISGFTLLEVMIALVILTIGILGIASMQISAIRGNSHGRQISEATSVASALMENLLAREYADACLVDTTADGDSGLDDSFDDRDLPHPTSTDTDDCIAVPVNVPQGYNLFWNVAEDWPSNRTKTIRIFVEGPQIQTFSIDMIKADI